MANQKKKVLIVEDEKIVLEALKEWLEDDGFEVECVDTGEKALERLKEDPSFSVVILDLRLPGMSGLDMYEKAKEFSRAKGIIITAYPTKETWDKAKALGIVDYFTKPFSVERLGETITTAISLFQIEAKEDFKLGVVSWRICDRDYQCKSCPLFQEIEERYGRIAYIPREELIKRKESPGDRRLCRFSLMTHFKPK